MPRRVTHKKQAEHAARQAPKSRVDPRLAALVRLLARQAAEKDFQALLKAQEAANDND